MSNANLNYCGAVILLRKLVENGYCTKREAQKMASRLFARFGANIIISL